MLKRDLSYDLFSREPQALEELFSRATRCRGETRDVRCFGKGGQIIRYTWEQS